MACRELGVVMSIFFVFCNILSLSKSDNLNVSSDQFARIECISRCLKLKRLRGGRATMTGSAADSFNKDDQHNLNRYVGYRERIKELKLELKQLQEEIDGLNEAHEEVASMDEETAKVKFKRNYPPALGFRWADTFTTWEPAAICEFLEYKIRMLESQSMDMESDMKEMTENMIEIRENMNSRYRFFCSSIIAAHSSAV